MVPFSPPYPHTPVSFGRRFCLTNTCDESTKSFGCDSTVLAQSSKLGATAGEGGPFFTAISAYPSMRSRGSILREKISYTPVTRHPGRSHHLPRVNESNPDSLLRAHLCRFLMDASAKNSFVSNAAPAQFWCGATTTYFDSGFLIRILKRETKQLPRALPLPTG